MTNKSNDDLVFMLSAFRISLRLFTRRKVSLVIFIVKPISSRFGYVYDIQRAIAIKLNIPAIRYQMHVVTEIVTKAFVFSACLALLQINFQLQVISCFIRLRTSLVRRLILAVLPVLKIEVCVITSDFLAKGMSEMLLEHTYIYCDVNDGR